MWRRSVHARVLLLFPIVMISVISTTFLLSTLETRRFSKTTTENIRRLFGAGKDNEENLDSLKASVAEKRREAERVIANESKTSQQLSAKDKKAASGTNNRISTSKIKSDDPLNNSQGGIENNKQVDSKTGRQVAAVKEKLVDTKNDKQVDTENNKQAGGEKDKKIDTINDKQVDTENNKQVVAVKEVPIDPSNEKQVSGEVKKSGDWSKVKTVKTANEQQAADKDKASEPFSGQPTANVFEKKSSSPTAEKTLEADSNELASVKNEKSNSAENNKPVAAEKGKPLQAVNNNAIVKANNKPVAAEKVKPLQAVDKNAVATENKPVVKISSEVSAIGDSKPLAQTKDKQIAPKMDRLADKTATKKPLPKVCDDWRLPNTNWSEVIEPQFKLDPTKFLYPGLIWGPNNQLVGFYQTIYVAIRLNRTLVVPQFHPHSSHGVIPAQERIDVTRLRSFVSTISLERFRAICKGSFDVAFQTQLIRTATVARFEEDTNMTLFQIPEDRVRKWGQGSTEARFSDQVLKDKPNIPAFPSSQYELKPGPWLNASSSYLRKLYNTEAPCAVFSSPFNPVKVGKGNLVALPINGSGLYASEVGDQRLYAAILDAIRRPRCVVEAAELYRREIFGDEDYVGLHWRFDTNDWVSVHCHGSNSYRFTEMCETIPKIIPLDVATAINASLRRKWTRIYIATPPKLDLFGFEVIEELRKLNKNLKKAKIGFFHFTLRRFEPCWLAANWSSPAEINALFDMEMMRNSSWLYYSDVSTFSNNVRYLRSEKAKDGVARRIFEKSAYYLAKAAMEARHAMEKLKSM